MLVCGACNHEMTSWRQLAYFCACGKAQCQSCTRVNKLSFLSAALIALPMGGLLYVALMVLLDAIPMLMLRHLALVAVLAIFITWPVLFLASSRWLRLVPLSPQKTITGWRGLLVLNVVLILCAIAVDMYWPLLGTFNPTAETDARKSGARDSP